MRKIKGGYFTDTTTTGATTTGASTTLNTVNSIMSQSDLSELTCSVDDIISAFNDNSDSPDISNFKYTVTTTGTPQELTGQEALREMLNEVIKSNSNYTINPDDTITQTGGGKYKNGLNKIINKIKKNLKQKLYKPKTTKPKTTKPKTTKTKTTKPKTTKTKTTKTKTTKPKMKSCNCKK